MDRVKKLKVKKSDGTFTDYIPIGADAKYVDLEYNGSNVEKILKKKPYYFNNIEEMKNCTYLQVNDVCQTLGYYEANDGGQGLYQIVDDDILVDDGGSIHDLVSELKAKLVIKNNTVNVTQFGAKGDGIHDDTENLRNCYNYKDGMNIYFKKGIYIISDRIEINKSHLKFFGNGSTLKYPDNNNLLTKQYLGNVSFESTAMFRFFKDYIEIYDFNLDGNNKNVYFIHDEVKYYGYAPDINISGIPKKYISTSGIDCARIGNVILKNININGIGVPINIGGEWGSGIIKENFLIENVNINQSFRDSIIVAEAKNITIKNCNILNSQRKAIQFYRNCHNALVDNCYFYNNVDEIYKWYPSWSPEISDAELTGIAIQNPNYTDNSENITIKNCKFDIYKIPIHIRNMSHNIVIDNNLFIQNDKNNSRITINISNGCYNLIVKNNHAISYSNNLNTFIRFGFDLNNDFTLSNYSSNGYIIIDNNFIENFNTGFNFQSNDNTPDIILNIDLIKNILKNIKNRYGTTYNYKNNFFKVYCSGDTEPASFIYENLQVINLYDNLNKRISALEN